LHISAGRGRSTWRPGTRIRPGSFRSLRGILLFRRLALLPRPVLFRFPRILFALRAAGPSRHSWRHQQTCREGKR
jgi:hypothetical protein